MRIAIRQLLQFQRDNNQKKSCFFILQVNLLVNFAFVVRRIIIYKDYFKDFYKNQDLKIQSKIEYVLDLVRFERQVPKKFYKLLANTDGIWEIRVITAFKSIRILCFHDKGDLVVLTNCFVKKTQKTPHAEIIKAEKLKKEYMKEKYGGK